ncbi:MAG: isoleucyl-tRNA synthetase, partial [Parcubacteria group bacterium Gr01-1014_70]
SYPFCWRCDTPLLNYAASSWFVNVSEARGELQKTNQEISWTPAHLKDGRFGKGLETAPDWAISRTRFWGAPLPVWKCAACEKQMVAGSLEDLEQHRFKKPNTYILMRHGEREDISQEKDNPNAYGPVVISSKPDADIHISEKGRARVKFMAEELRKKGGIDLIYSSDFVRTRETAELMSKALQAPVVYDEHLRELNHGDHFEGRTVAEYYAFFGSPEERFTKKPEGGETLKDVQKRMMLTLQEIEATHEGKRILVVSHGDPLWILEGALKNMSGKELIAYRETNYMKQGETRLVELKNFPYGEDGRLNMHRPYIDDIVLKCDCGGEMKRILEVFDCWFESGSMPYGQHHYKGTPLAEFDPTSAKGFPADFIAEGLDQTRGWFYSLHVLATALFKKPAYKRVVVNGIILAEDGQKMSKRLKNYPDPMDVITTYGADALRLYILSSPAVYAEDMNFSEKGVDEVYKKVVQRLLNVLSFYEQYTGSKAEEFQIADSLHVLDKFILVELENTKETVEKALDEYQIQRASRAVSHFIDVLSTGYLQYSRDRFKEDSTRHEFARGTLWYVLSNIAKMIAPLVPFLAEEVHSRVKYPNTKESVHLEDWPVLDAHIKTFQETAKDAAEIPRIVEWILAERNSAGIPVRQPLRLAKVMYLPKNETCREVIGQRVNVEHIEEDASLDAARPAWIDPEITPDLREKGMVREFTRGVQEARKKAGLKPQDHITLQVSVGDVPRDFFERYKDEIARAVHADSLVFGEEPGEHEIALSDQKISVSIIHNS